MKTILILSVALWGPSAAAQTPSAEAVAIALLIRSHMPVPAIPPRAAGGDCDIKASAFNATLPKAAPRTTSVILRPDVQRSSDAHAPCPVCHEPAIEVEESQHAPPHVIYRCGSEWGREECFAQSFHCFQTEHPPAPVVKAAPPIIAPVQKATTGHYERRRFCHGTWCEYKNVWVAD